MDLTVQQLRLVLAVHDTGGFTPAAEQLHLAQSSISRAVRDVERRLGITLFQRTTRHLVTTPEGAEFCLVARRVVDSFDAGINHFRGFLAGTRGRVRIAALPSMAAVLLPGAVSAYRAGHPDVELSIEDGMSDEVLAKVRAGTADLGVTVVAEDLPDLAVHPIASDRMCAVFPPDHRLASRESLTWAELATEPHIAFAPNSSIRQHADRAFTAARAHPAVALESGNITAVAGLVAAGLGAATMPGVVLPLAAFAGLAHVPLVAPETHRRIAVIRAPDHPLPPATRAFIAELTRTRPNAPETTWDGGLDGGLFEPAAPNRS